MTYWTSRNLGTASQLKPLPERINRLFGPTWPPAAHAYPAVNVWTNNDGVVLSAEVPGVDAASLEVATLKGTLTIKGTIPPGGGDDEQSWHRRDRRHGDFARSIQLPYAVDPETVQATLKDGILEVRLQRIAAQKPRRIEIKTG